MSGPPLLEITSLTKRYGGVTAVDDVTMSLDRGEVVGLVGPNGAGKTTLVDLITGVQSADKGTIRIDGRRVRPAPHRRAQAGLARTFQHPLLAHSLTVRENILLGRASVQDGSVRGSVTGFLRGALRPSLFEDRERVEALAAEVNLSGLDREARDLTLGEQRVLEVARALGQDPKVLLLDEPFAGADTKGIDGIIDAIASVRRRGCGVVLVDHNIDLVSTLVDRFVLLALGAVVFDGEPRECLASAEMNRVYFGAEEPV